MMTSLRCYIFLFFLRNNIVYYNKIVVVLTHIPYMIQYCSNQPSIRIYRRTNFTSLSQAQLKGGSYCRIYVMLVYVPGIFISQSRKTGGVPEAKSATRTGIKPSRFPPGRLNENTICTSRLCNHLRRFKLSWQLWSMVTQDRYF